MSMAAPPRGVKVRMYRHGLGDCFLLAFPGADGSPRYLLIDCGILLNSPGERTRIQTVIEHVRDETKSEEHPDGHLHVLVATHEHWDHVCGFLHQQELFGKMAVDEVWMAWTEDPADPQGRELTQKREQGFRAVSSALTRMRGMDSEAAQEQTGQVEAVLQFFGGPSREAGLGFSKRTDSAMKLVAEGRRVRYRAPGETFQLSGVDGVRFYVLGPPRDAELFRSDPRQGEAYEEQGAPALDGTRSLAQALRQGIDAGLSHDDELWELSKPFDSSHEVPLDRSREHPWFGEHYYAAAGFDDRDQQWRRIDESWVSGAAELALQLDSDTNNTSLVIAIELDGKGVLLFPGDAQAGSWRSWENVRFQVPDRDQPLPAHDLLGRVKLYKVGHHGSHNATLRAKGLELMPDGFTALVPVDRNVAMAPARKWNMPFPSLYQRLLEKTRGRVIRADLGVEPQPAGVPAEEWAAFQAGLVHAGTTLPAERESVERPLYVELTIEP